MAYWCMVIEIFLLNKVGFYKAICRLCVSALCLTIYDKQPEEGQDDEY
jgi:hypothetical protein